MNSLKVSPVGNPAMPPMPILNISMPSLMGVLPGMTEMATMMMKSSMKKAQVATISELLESAKDSGVKFLPCQMAMDVMGIKFEDFIDGVEKPVGAATALDYALNANTSLFV